MKPPSSSRLKSIVRRFPGKRILVLGDIMLDHYVKGKVARLSPEAPVPVVHVRQESHVPGGGGNVACNLASLDARVSLISVAGADDAGYKLLKSMTGIGIDVSGVILDSERTTTEKTRVIAEHQQVVRFDREDDGILPAGMQGKCLKNLRERIDQCDCVLLSDYGKGVLSSVNLKSVIESCRRKNIPVCVDPKVEHFQKYRMVTCMTPNIQEAWTGMGLHPQEGRDQVEALGKKILKNLSCQALLITQGEYGMTLFEARPSRILHIPTHAREVFDVTGAGDTVISVISLAIASGASFHEAALLSNFAAGVVVGKLGTASLTRRELVERINTCAEAKG